MMKNWLVRGGCALLYLSLLLFALIIGLDSVIFAYALEQPGRIDGCYTLLDNLFNTRAPVDAFRGAEFVGGLAIVARLLFLFLRSGWRGVHRFKPQTV